MLNYTVDLGQNVTKTVTVSNGGCVMIRSGGERFLTFYYFFFQLFWIYLIFSTIFDLFQQCSDLNWTSFFCD